MSITPDLDLEDFWQENALCLRQLDGGAPRPGLVLMFEEYFLTGVLPELNSERYYTDLSYRGQQHRRANDRFEKEMGLRPYPENRLSYMKGALEVRLGARRELTTSGTAWLLPAVETADQFAKWVDRVANLDLREEPVPTAWRQDQEAFTAATGKAVSFLPSMTGPVTMASALLGLTDLCLWAMDEPESMDEFFAVLCTRQIEFFEARWMVVNCRHDIGCGSRRTRLLRRGRACRPHLAEQRDPPQ